MTVAVIALLAVVVLAGGCGDDGAESAGPTPPAPATTPTTPPPPPPPAPPPSPQPSPPAAQPMKCGRAVGGDEGVYTNLVAVRIGTHPGFDRITFEFEAPRPNPGGTAGIPRYQVGTVKPPLTQDPSGLPLGVQGKSFVGVLFQGASGVGLDGEPTYTGPKTIPAGFDMLVEAAQSGDFEATLSWILGLRQKGCWQVREFRDPDRVAIDIAHTL